MLTQVKLCACAALVTIAIVGPSYAQTLERSYDDPMRPVIEIAKQSHEFSGIQHPASAAAESLPGRTRYMETMLTEIATWLSTNLDLPAIQDRPRVEFASPMKLAGMRYSGLLPDQWREDTLSGPIMQAALTREVIALYYDPTRTIFLSTGWTGASLAERSVIVHEMVHHLQNLAGLKYGCPPARERLAYLAQDQWLRLHGSTLEKEFGIDNLTMMVNSACLS